MVSALGGKGVDKKKTRVLTSFVSVPIETVIFTSWFTTVEKIDL